jgi:hypothetical protein
MTITNTIKYTLSFKVEYFEATETGMDSEQFGVTVGELSDALRVLESAKNTRPRENWIITIEALLIT